MVCSNDSPSAEDIFFSVLHTAATVFIQSLAAAVTSAAMKQEEKCHHSTPNGNGRPKKNRRGPNDDFSVRLQQQFSDVIAARKNLWDFGYNNDGSSSMPPALADGADVHDLSEGDVCVMTREANFKTVVANLLSTVTGSFGNLLSQDDFNPITTALESIINMDQSNGIFQQYQINQQLVIDPTKHSKYTLVNFQGYVVYMKYQENNEKYVAITPVILGYYAVQKDNSVVPRSFEPISLVIIVTGMTVIGIIQAIKSHKAKISADLSKFKFDIEINQKVVNSHHGSLDMGLEVDVVPETGFGSDKQSTALQLTEALTKEDVFGGHQFTVKF